MIEENVWDNELHSDLFKLFILASNGFIVHMSDYDSIHHKICENLTGNVPVRYPFQFNDRAVCEESYTVYVDNEFVRDTKAGVNRVVCPAPDGRWNIKATITIENKND